VSSGRQAAASRFSDEDGKTAVKVGEFAQKKIHYSFLFRFAVPPSRARGCFNVLTRRHLAVRVRPPLQSSDPGYDLVPQRFRNSTVTVTTPTSLAVESAQGKKLFVFDRVFGPDVDQEGVWEYLQDSVNSFVQGYNVSILAYGQSGAGKSYTMGTTGPNEQNDPNIMGGCCVENNLGSITKNFAGVVPRAAAALFDKLVGPALRSGIRSPARYSTNGMAAIANFNRPVDKNWQMKATYVEVSDYQNYG